MVQVGSIFLNEEKLNRIYLSLTDDVNDFDIPLYVVMAKIEGEEPFELSRHATYEACIDLAKEVSEKINKLRYSHLYEYDGPMMMKQHRGVAIYG